MPVPENITLQVQVNSGPIVTGGLTVAHSDTIDLSVDNTAGIQQYLWEIYEYPKGMVLADIGSPAGWSLDGVTGIISSTDAVPAQFNFPASTTLWGKIFLRLIVNTGKRAGVKAPDLIDERTAIKTLSPLLALDDIGFRETDQFGGFRQWIDALKDNLRALDGIAAGGFTAPANPADDGKVAIAAAGDIAWTAGGGVGHVLTWNGSAWVSQAAAAAVTWADVLGNGFVTGANDPEISAGRHINWADELAINIQGSPAITSDVGQGQILVQDALIWISQRNALGVDPAMTTAALNGLATLNNTASAAGAGQYTPYLSFIAGAWDTDAGGQDEAIGWGIQGRPIQFNSANGHTAGTLSVRATNFQSAATLDVAHFALFEGEPAFVIEGVSGAVPATTGRGLRVANSFAIWANDVAEGQNELIFIWEADTLGLATKSGEEFHVLHDGQGTQDPIAIFDWGEVEVYHTNGIDPVVGISNEGVDVSDIGATGQGIRHFSAQSPNDRGEAVTFGLDTDNAFSAQNNLPATVSENQFSKYISWTGAQWDTNLAATNKIQWGFQLRTESHDHTALPDPYGQLVLTAHHVAARDVLEIRHETDANDVPRTYVGPTAGDSNFIMQMRGRDAIAAATAGRELRAGGGDGATTGVGGQFTIFGGFSASGTEGVVAAIKHHAIAQTVNTANEVALGVQNITAATAGVQQYSPYLMWAASAWDANAVAAVVTTWGVQVRTASFNGSVLEDFGRYVWRGGSGATQEDLIEFAANKLASGAVVTVVRNAGDSGSVTYRGMDALTAATAGGAGTLQGGVATTTGRGGLALVTGGPSPSGNQGDAQVEGFNVLLQSFATSFQGMVGGFVIDEATTLPTGNPTSSPQQIFVFVDPADGFYKYRDSVGTIHTM